MADKRPYAKLDVGYLSNPKIATLIDDNPRAVLLHLACIAYGVQHATDGIVPVRIAMRIVCGTQCDLDLLMQSGLLIDADDGNVEVRDFLEHQRSAAEVKSRSQAAIDAAAARWDAERNAKGNAERNAERERKKERTTSSPDGDGFEAWWAVYPKKVGKGQARPAYKRALGKTTSDVLLAAVQAYTQQTATADPKFIAHPTTWLNGERWLDAAPAEPAGPTTAQQMGWC